MAASARLLENRDLQTRLAHIDSLVGELQRLPDPAARAMAEELLSTVLDLHGEALSRLLEKLGDPGDPAIDRLLHRIVEDDLISGLLLLHGLHPVDLPTRVEAALESVRPYMRSHGGGVELVDIVGDAVHIRLEGHCKGCPSSQMTLKLAVEKAIFEAAPDVSEIQVEAPPEDATAVPPDITGLVTLPLVASAVPRQARRVAAAPSGAWSTVVPRASDIAHGEVLLTRVDGEAVAIARVNDVCYAYLARCPTCGSAMRDATLDGTTLTCGTCGTGFDIRNAGAGVDSDLRIEPLPLLEDAGALRIAIPQAAP